MALPRGKTDKKDKNWHEQRFDNIELVSSLSAICTLATKKY